MAPDKRPERVKMSRIPRSVIMLFIIFVMMGFGEKAVSETDEPRSMEAVETSQPPEIDGKLDDPCWKNAPRATDFVDKFFDRVVEDQTVAYLLYDRENIYIAFYCYDSQPGKIVARETKREGYFRNDDYVAFCIDPFHAHQFDYRSFFVVNAIGTQFSKIAGGRASKTEWKGDWQAAVSRTRDGWTAEMAIPFAILSYPSTDEPVTIGINFDRKQQRTDINSFWSNIGPQEHTEKDGHLVGIVFPKAGSKRRLSVMTYAFAGRESDESNTFRAGLNAKYSITSEMTAVASINPDFSNVEQEVESIDFSYRERFYPDRRPFFQEGGDVIRSRSWSFYSRRIPQFDLGLKTYGKIGKITLGALDCIDFSNASDIGSDPINRNDLVIATKIDLGKSSIIPVEFIRRDDPELWNHALVIQPSFRWKNLSIGGAWEGSQTKGGKDGADYFAYVDWNTKHFYSSAFGSYVTPDFEIADGLIPYNDTKTGGFSAGYGTEWRSGMLKSAGGGINASRTDRLDGSRYESNVGAYGRSHFRSDHSVEMGVSKGRYEEYRDWTLWLNLAGNVGNQYKEYGLNVSYGRREDADYRFLSPYINFRFQERLSLRLRSQFLWHSEDKKQHVLILNYDITPERGLGARLVYRDDEFSPFIYRGGKFNAFITFRQAVRRGIDAFIIIGDPNAEEMQKRALAKIILPL